MINKKPHPIRFSPSPLEGEGWDGGGLRGRQSSRSSLGFTLIELVLALSLAAVLAAALGGVLRGAVGTWRDLRESSRARQRAQAVFERLGRDLRNSLPFPGETFKGSEGELVFKTVVDVPQTQTTLETFPRVARVSYGRETTPDGTPQLVLEQKVYSPVPLSETLDQRVTLPADVKFSFAYGGGPDGQVLWEDVWTDTTTVPRGIKAELFFPGKKGPMRYESAFQIPTGAFPPWKE